MEAVKPIGEVVNMRLSATGLLSSAPSNRAIHFRNANEFWGLPNPITLWMGEFYLQAWFSAQVRQYTPGFLFKGVHISRESP